MNSFLGLVSLLIFTVANIQGQLVPYGVRTSTLPRLARQPPISSHPKIINVETQCYPQGMSVTINFDLPFIGLVYASGFFGETKCRFAEGAHGSGSTQLSFGIPANDCGTKENKLSKSLSSLLVFQMDEDVQEIWDISRKVSCSYAKSGDVHEKMVVFKPLSVGMLDVQHHPIKNEELDCWMDIQVGKYPNISPIKGQLPIGEELSVLIFLKDEEKLYDVRVKDCWAFDMDHFEDAKTSKVQLTGYDGCPKKVKLIGSWDKTLDTGDSGATIIAYTNMTAFKFPTTDNVHLTCNMELCRGICQPTNCDQLAITAGPTSRVPPTPYPSQRYTQPQGPGSPSLQRVAGPTTPPSCVGGSTDPRCGNGTDYPAGPGFTGVCPPGSLNPECLQYPGDQDEQEGSKGFTPQDVSEDEILGEGYVASTTPQTIYENQNTPRYPSGSQSSRAPLCYPGQPDPRCPGSQSTGTGSGTSRPFPTTYQQPESTTRKMMTYPNIATTVELRCYPGSTDTRCPKESTERYDEQEELVEEPGYTPTQPDRPTGNVRLPGDQTSKPFRCYPGTRDPRCPESYGKPEPESEVDPDYFTTAKPSKVQTPTQGNNGYPRPDNRYQPTTAKPATRYTNSYQPTTSRPADRFTNGYQPSTARPADRYTNGYQPTTARPADRYTTGNQPTTARPADRYTNGNQPTTVRPADRYTNGNQPTTARPTDRYTNGFQSTTAKSRFPGSTTPKVLCYPGQPDPRCPGSYPENAPYNPNAPETLYDYPTPTPKPIQRITPSKSTTLQNRLSVTTLKPVLCYPGTQDPRCKSYSTTLKYQYEPEPDRESFPTPKPSRPALSAGSGQPSPKAPYEQPGTSPPYQDRYQPPAGSAGSGQPRPHAPYEQPGTNAPYQDRYQTPAGSAGSGQPSPKAPYEQPGTNAPYQDRYQPPAGSAGSGQPRPKAPYEQPGTNAPYQDRYQPPAGSAGSGQPSPKAPHEQPGTNAPYQDRYQPGVTTPKPRFPVPVTQKPVLCYPGQIDPRCPPVKPTPEEEVVHNEFESEIEGAGKYHPSQPTQPFEVTQPPSLFEPPTTLVNEYGPTQNAYGPTSATQQPKQTGYGERPGTQNNYSVKPAGYRPPQTAEQPQQGTQQPKPTGYRPPQTAEQPQQYTQQPKPTGYRPQQTPEQPQQYTQQPKPTGYTAKPTGYRPQQTAEQPQQGTQQTKPNDYRPPQTADQPQQIDYRPKQSGYQPQQPYEPKPTEQKPDGIDRKPYIYDTTKGYIYKPPNGTRFTYDTTSKPTNGKGYPPLTDNSYQPAGNGKPQPGQYTPNGKPSPPGDNYQPGVTGNGKSPPIGNDFAQPPTNGYQPPSTNGRSTTTRPVICYPGQIDPRCPKVCYEGSTDRRCTRKREVAPTQTQLICFSDSTDPRCPKFN